MEVIDITLHTIDCINLMQRQQENTAIISFIAYPGEIKIFYLQKEVWYGNIQTNDYFPFYKVPLLVFMMGQQNLYLVESRQEALYFIFNTFRFQFYPWRHMIPDNLKYRKVAFPEKNLINLFTPYPWQFSLYLSNREINATGRDLNRSRDDNARFIITILFFCFVPDPIKVLFRPA